MCLRRRKGLHGRKLSRKFQNGSPIPLSSNGPMLRAAIQSQGFDVFEINAITSDERGALKESILKALAEADMVITSGGVSMGKVLFRLIQCCLS